MAAEGRQVAVVSGGDPGVFAMAAAVFEAIETGEPSWRALDVTVVPGISAHAGRGRPARRAAGARFLRHLAVRQPETVGHQSPAACAPPPTATS